MCNWGGGEGGGVMDSGGSYVLKEYVMVDLQIRLKKRDYAPIADA